MSSISVDFHIEDMSGTLVLVVRALYLSLVLRRAMIVYRNMAGISVVILIGNALYDTELFLIHTGELTGKSLGRGSEQAVIMP